MDELKKLIEEHRAIFDSAEPSEGHFGRFEDMLSRQNCITPKVPLWPTFLKAASVAILAVLSGLYITEHFITPNQKLANTQNTEFIQTQTYYVQQVNQRIDMIETMETQMNDEQKEMLVEELSEMDNLYKKLQQDYNDRPNDPRIIQAMLQHYQMKMEVLNRLITNLQNINQVNTTDYENVEL